MWVLVRFNPSCGKSLSSICIFFIFLILSRGLIATFSWQPYFQLEGSVLNWFDIFHVVSIFLTGKQAEVSNFHTSWGTLMFFFWREDLCGIWPCHFSDDINLYWDNSSPLAWNLPKGQASLSGIHRDAPVSISPVWGVTCVPKFFSFFSCILGLKFGPLWWQSEHIVTYNVSPALT